MAETNTLDLTDLNTDEEPSVQAEITDAPDPVEEEPEEVEEPEDPVESYSLDAMLTAKAHMCFPIDLIR